MLDKAEYSAFESTLNSSIVSYRIVSSEPAARRLLAASMFFFRAAFRIPKRGYKAYVVMAESIGYRHLIIYQGWTSERQWPMLCNSIVYIHIL